MLKKTCRSVRTHKYHRWECKLVQPFCKLSWCYIVKLNIYIIYDPARLSLETLVLVCVWCWVEKKKSQKTKWLSLLYSLKNTKLNNLLLGIHTLIKKFKKQGNDKHEIQESANIQQRSGEEWIGKENMGRYTSTVNLF